MVDDQDRRGDPASNGLQLTSSVIGALLLFALIIILGLMTDELYELDEHLETQRSDIAINRPLIGALAVGEDGVRSVSRGRAIGETNVVR